MIFNHPPGNLHPEERRIPRYHRRRKLLLELVFLLLWNQPVLGPLEVVDMNQHAGRTDRHQVGPLDFLGGVFLSHLRANQAVFMGGWQGGPF